MQCIQIDLHHAFRNIEYPLGLLFWLKNLAAPWNFSLDAQVQGIYPRWTQIFKNEKRILHAGTFQILGSGFANLNSYTIILAWIKNFFPLFS